MNLSRAAWLAFAFAGVTTGTTAALLLFATREVVMVLPFAPEIVAMNRATRGPADSVAAIYGTPVGGDDPASATPRRPATTRVVFARADRLIRPIEDSELLLLKLDQQAGDHPLQAMTVRYIGLRLAGAFGAVGLLLMAIARFRAGRVGA